MIVKLDRVLATIGLLRDHGISDIALFGTPDLINLPADYLSSLPDAVHAICITPPMAPPAALGGRQVIDSHVAADSGVQALIAVENHAVPELMRNAEALQRAGKIVVPADPDAVVSAATRFGDRIQIIWNWAPAEYVARTGLKGHYLEFGTFWGRSFYNAYFFMHQWLQGEFFGFDSFAGLSLPDVEETAFTAGDFQEGAYACNQESFEMIGRLVGSDLRRVHPVKGFYRDTLVGIDPACYGLSPKSVSVCVIDCDLLEPTMQVLNFITPLLESGALLYFDDWRLCRASPHVGERAAALAWLRRNPRIDLVEFHRDHWQHQWFIYHQL